MAKNISKYPLTAEKFREIRIHFCKNSNIQFAEETGIHYVTLSSFCSGSKYPGTEVRKKILETFPEINKAWLMVDDYDGEMLRPGAIQHNNGNQNCTITNVDNSTTATAEVAELRSQLKSANETIHALTSMLSTKMTELQSSVDIINKLLNED